MDEIINKLKEFKENIDCDIKAGLNDSINNDIRQSSQLAQAIGLLENLGANNNIAK